MSLHQTAIIAFFGGVAILSFSCERDVPDDAETVEDSLAHSIEIFNVPYDDEKEFEWMIEFPTRDELQGAGSIVFDQSEILGVEVAGSDTHHRFVFQKQSVPKLLDFLESTERGMIFVAVDGKCIEASLGGCRPCQSIDGTFPPESIELINTILGYKPSRKTSGEQGGARQPTTAPDSKSEGNENPEPESEGRSQ